MILKDITLVFMDKRDRFAEVMSQVSKLTYKDILVFENAAELKSYMNEPGNREEYIVLFLHIAANSGLEGLRSGLKEDINALFPELSIHLITRNDTQVMAHDLEGYPLYTYYYIRKNIEDGILIPQKVSQMLLAEKSTEYRIDYGIITALYDDEFEAISGLFDWEPDSNPADSKIRYKIGVLKANPQKRVVASYQAQTGMVDAAVVATHMIEVFKPKYLLMPGVCGGSEQMKLGTVVVANGVFSFQRGKVSDLKDNKGRPVKILFKKDKSSVNITELYDKDGRSVNLTIENFERENDLISMDSGLKSVIQAAIPEIKNEINKEYGAVGLSYNVVFEKMACSSMVINKGDYFNQNIRTIDRKTVAVEMESFGIAKACELANGGRTKFLIFKGVMDNTKDKTDVAKLGAARMSALFLKHLLAGNYI